jgi:MFS superfamily sulfate permease-like transporter
VIAESQLKALLGLDTGTGPSVAGSNVFADVYDIVSNIKQAHWQTCVLSLVCIAVLLLGGHKRVPKWLPTILLLMIACTLTSFLAHFELYGIRVVGYVPVRKPLRAHLINKMLRFCFFPPRS